MLTAENMKAIQWVADQIELQSELFDQGRYGALIYKSEYSGYNNLVVGDLLAEACGTPQCIAGWAVNFWIIENGFQQLAMAELKEQTYDSGHWIIPFVEKAKEVFGMTYIEATAWFMPTEIDAGEMVKNLRSVLKEGSW